MDALAAARAHLNARGVEHLETVVILGSGLGDVAQMLVKDALLIPYREIPGMPATFIGGHRGELLIDVGRHRAIAVGRAHLYQEISARDVVFPVRLAAAMGAKRIILTNAAGSLTDTIAPGSLVLISDHLNLTGATPLSFLHPLTLEPQFVPMVDAYSPAWRTLALTVAQRLGISLMEGVYAGVLGPAYETPAEVTMLRIMGAAVVGMSTVLETIAARALGMEVLGISLATNAAGTSDTHAEVLAAAALGAHDLASLLHEILNTESAA